MIENSKQNNIIALKINLRLLLTALLITNIATIILWKPWSTTKAVRKISVTGQSVVKSSPDQYVLYPYFEFTNADRAKANAELSAQATTVTSKLKELGVSDDQIKSNTNGYDKYNYGAPSESNTLTLSYTVTLTDKEIAQKVQDYMLSINAKGQISPQASFSDAKQKQLQSQARDQAINDAKTNATATAKQVNAKVGKVITISDGYSAGGPIALSVDSMAMDSKAEVGTATAPGIPVQVGQNDYKYSVVVEYELK